MRSVTLRPPLGGTFLMLADMSEPVDHLKLRMLGVPVVEVGAIRVPIQLRFGLHGNFAPSAELGLAA